MSNIQIVEIPIDQAHILYKKHAVGCPMNKDPHCDYCTCGLQSKNKLGNDKNKYEEGLRQQRASKIDSDPKNNFTFQNHNNFNNNKRFKR